MASDVFRFDAARQPQPNCSHEALNRGPLEQSSKCNQTNFEISKHKVWLKRTGNNIDEKAMLTMQPASPGNPRVLFQNGMNNHNLLQKESEKILCIIRCVGSTEKVKSNLFINLQAFTYYEAFTLDFNSPSGFNFKFSLQISNSHTHTFKIL